MIMTGERCEVVILVVMNVKGGCYFLIIVSERQKTRVRTDKDGGEKG